MEYIKVRWIHSFSDEPSIIFSELDSDRNEIRKIEKYKNGKVQIASQHIYSHFCQLSIYSIPFLDEINSDNQFEGCLISKEEFEKEWKAAILSI